MKAILLSIAACGLVAAFPPSGYSQRGNGYYWYQNPTAPTYWSNSSYSYSYGPSYYYVAPSNPQPPVVTWRMHPALEQAAQRQATLKAAIAQNPSLDAMNWLQSNGTWRSDGKEGKKYWISKTDPKKSASLSAQASNWLNKNGQWKKSFGDLKTWTPN